MRANFDRIGRVLKKPPHVIAERVLQEVRAQADRYLAPLRAKRLSPQVLARRAGHADCQSWWQALAQRPYACETALSSQDLERLCPGEEHRIFTDAGRCLARKVDLLGSGPIELGSPIDWHKDYKTGFRWAPAYCRDFEYNNLDRPSDVKFPWEISRMQWVIPAGQAYALSADERYAIAARDLIAEWIGANPYACSINWACTMDVALRLMTWTWLFHVFHSSAAWSERAFQERFLQSLYLHGDFTARHLEKSDVNGNHYTADAAGLVFAGLFFGNEGEPGAWATLGWNILACELPRQVFADGVDFEASIPYHRLVQELFLYPALYRLKCGLDVPESYRQRLLAMARFTAAYSRADGGVPLLGDADDARALPFKQRPIKDHRYLLALCGIGFSEPTLLEVFSGPKTEPLWFFGPDAAAALSGRAQAGYGASAAFPDGGFYVLRNSRDHVFIDCGPLGLEGRGGHGHNDLLSFEAVLDGVHLVTDCGAYLYTASMTDRNLFRSTAYHNTPRVDGEEINSFIRPDYLWTLHDDARHAVGALSFSAGRDVIAMSHTGYQKLPSPVTVRRTIELHHGEHRLIIRDSFEGEGEHAVEVPLHFAPGVTPELSQDGGAILYDAASDKRFSLTWAAEKAWQIHIEDARVSPTYGVCVASKRLVWRRNNSLSPLSITIAPNA